MKKILLILLFMPIIGRGQNSVLDQKNGFKDLHINDDAEKIIALIKGIGKKLNEDSNLSVYLLVNTKYNQLGKCKIRQVLVSLFNKKLYSIMLRTDASNSHCVLEGFKSIYGGGIEVTPDLKTCLWEGSNILLHYREYFNKSADIAFFSKMYQSQFEEYMNAKEKKDSSRL